MRLLAASRASYSAARVPSTRRGRAQSGATADRPAGHKFRLSWNSHLAGQVGLGWGAEGGRCVMSRPGSKVRARVHVVEAGRERARGDDLAVEEPLEGRLPDLRPLERHFTTTSA